MLDDLKKCTHTYPYWFGSICWYDEQLRFSFLSFKPLIMFKNQTLVKCWIIFQAIFTRVKDSILTWKNQEKIKNQCACMCSLAYTGAQHIFQQLSCNFDVVCGMNSVMQRKIVIQMCIVTRKMLDILLGILPVNYCYRKVFYTNLQTGISHSHLRVV